MTKRLQIWAVSLCATLLGGNLAQALDRVELVSGEVLYGTLLRSNRYEVSLQLRGGGILSFQRSRVERVRLDPLESPRERAEELLELDLFAAEGEPSTTRGASEAQRRGTPDADLEFGPEPNAPEVFVGSTPLPEWLLEHGREAPARSEVSVSIIPPDGFAKVRGKMPPNVLESYRDPLTDATCVVVVVATDASIAEVRRGVTHATADEFESFRVLRNEPYPVDTEGAWIVEVEGTSEERAFRQLQVFLPLVGGVAIATFRTLEEHWKKHAPLFSRSARTLRIYKPDAASPAKRSSEAS